MEPALRTVAQDRLRDALGLPGPGNDASAQNQRNASAGRGRRREADAPKAASHANRGTRFSVEDALRQEAEDAIGDALGGLFGKRD